MLYGTYSAHISTSENKAKELSFLLDHTKMCQIQPRKKNFLTLVSIAVAERAAVGQLEEEEGERERERMMIGVQRSGK